MKLTEVLRNLREVVGSDDFLDAYITAALWSSTDDDDQPLDANYDDRDLTAAALKKMRADTAKFQKDNAELLDKAGDASQNGHDFWLTRNGHGAGFWDRGYDKAVGDALTKAAKKFGDVYLSVSDGKIHHD